MANYDLMIYYISTVDNDIKILREKPGSKAIVKQLIKLQEFTRDEWAKIHSIVKSLANSTPEEAFKKSQAIVTSCFNMNLKINVFYNKLTDICLLKKQKGNVYFLNYVLEEMFYNYSLFLDALHIMGIYYIPCETFPFTLSDMFANRKMAELIDREEDENTP
jgi:hypothetical protein